MQSLHFPWLELATFVPLVGAIVVSRIDDFDSVRRTSIIVSAATLFLAIGAWFDFATLHAFEAHDPWLESFGLYHADLFVVDELSAPLLPLGAMLYLATIATTLRTKVRRFSFVSTLVSESILMALLSCRAPWGIVVLLSLATIPPALEIQRRGRSARLYWVYMGLFVVCLTGGQSMIGTEDFSSIGVLVVTLAALLRSGVFPLHGWITELFERAGFGTALLAVIPMTGAYAVVRLVLPVAPAWGMQGIAIVSLATAVYAAGMALVQHEARRFFCFVFLSHASLVLVGLEMVTPIGLTGALYVWLSVGISLGGFGLALRCIEARTGRLSLDGYHGLSQLTPLISGFFLLSGLASVGFPGTVGFVGAELLVEGAVDVYPLIGLSVVIAAMLNGIAVVQAYFRVFTGVRREATATMGCRPSERVLIIVLSAMMLGGGLYPQPGVASRYHAAEEIIMLRSDLRAPDEAEEAEEADAHHAAAEKQVTVELD